MCIDPATATAMLTIASATMSYISETQMAQSQMDSIADNEEAKQRAYAEQQKQVNEQAADKMTERARQAVIERGRLRAIQGESGLTGNSQDRVMGEVSFNEGYDISSIENNRQNQIRQTRSEAAASRDSAKNEINAVKRPSLIGTGLQIASAATTYRQSTAKPKPKS